MLRAYKQHLVRKSEELSNKYWDFHIQNSNHGSIQKQVFVPGCIDKIPGLENYQGWSEYKTYFQAEGNVRLEFKGVSHYAIVLLDGKEVARHYNSYTSFSTVVTNLVHGNHELVVRVDNSFKEEYALNFPNDYMSYGGISRGVLLELVKDVFIEWVHITPIKEEKEGWLFNTEVCCRNLTQHKLDAKLSLLVGKYQILEKHIQIDKGISCYQYNDLLATGVISWNIESPNLYEVGVQLEMKGIIVDDLVERVGFRCIRVEGNRIMLNGKPIRIKGFCRHEDHPQFGCALPISVMAADLEQIKDMGGNSIRTTHYPNDELFLDLCDELGILVWEENHARGLKEDRMRNPYFEKQCEQVIKEMITSHYNHPSIYIWGILNECASDTEFGRKCYASQYALIRQLDRSRPCSSASCRFYKDICQDLEDVYSWNFYPYWYTDETADEKIGGTYEWINEKGGNGIKPFLVTEVGAGAIYGYHDRGKAYWSEELQAEIVEKQLKYITEHTEWSGCYIWQFCDVKVSKERWGVIRPRNYNNKGIVDEYRRPKLVYDVVRQIYRKIPNYWADSQSPHYHKAFENVSILKEN